MRGRTLNWTILIFGYAFLYVPILLMIIYSFNASRYVTDWQGFSFKWYGALLEDERIQDAALLSLQIAAINATVATILGTLAGLVLVRFGRFRGRTLFTGLVSAPLVMPEVVTGLSMLLLFVAMADAIGWPSDRGMTTITIAHITFTMAYVAVVVQSRLTDMDASIEEAALDLGARPLKVFFVITLPLIAPALAAGWLLAFTLSLDDLVVTSFTAGPESTTLPMEIFARVRLGVSPVVNALATIIVLIVGMLVLLSAWLTYRKETSRLQDSQRVNGG